MKKRLLVVVTTILIVLMMWGCKSKPDVNPVAIIGIDGLEWQLVERMIAAGDLPNLKKVMEKGTLSDMKTLEPTLSPAIWTTVATGVLPETHGITWFLVKDANGQMMPVTSAQRRVKALWNIVSEDRRDVDVVGWWATWPAENVRGRIISDHMGYHIFAIQSDKIDTEIGNTYPEKLNDELSPMKVDPFDIPIDTVKRYMGISDLEFNVSIDMKALCDRPEYKECVYCRGESDIPFCHFNPLHHFLRALATLESFNDMTIYLLNKKQPDLLMLYFEWVDVVSHQYMKFMPPKMEWANEDQFAKYNDVIRQTYIRQDEILGETLAALAPNTNVLIMSDHGFKIDDERLKEEQVTTVAKAHLWHSQPAFLAMYGPDLRKGGKKIRSRVQDITPTVLALMAMPVAEDMDGGVLKDAFQPAFLQKFPIKRIPTYESKRDHDDRVDGVEENVGSSNISPQIKEHLKALGYIGDVDNTGLEMGRARLLLDKGKFNEASKVAEAVLAKDPNNIKAIAMLGDLYFQMKRFKKAAAVFAKIEEIPEDEIPPMAEPIIVNVIANWGIALMNMGNLETAKEKCMQATARNSSSYMAQFCLGRIAEIKQETGSAIKYYEETVRLNPASAEAHNNLGNCYFRENEYKKAIEQYEKASEVNPAHVECHHNAGVAYQKLKKYKDAEREFEAALNLNPNLAPSIGEIAGVRMKLKKYEEAAKNFLKLAEMQPGNPAPLVQAAGAYMAAKDRDQAIVLLKKARVLNPIAVDQRIATDKLFKSLKPEDLK